MLKKIITLTCMCLLLAGCSEKEEVITVTPPVSERMDSVIYENFTFDAIGPVCGFILTDTSLQIHPYYDSTKHILVEKILISENGFWNTLITSQTENYVLTDSENYSLITTPSGVTFGYMRVDDEWALLFKTSDLNSGYLRLVMNKLWQHVS